MNCIIIFCNNIIVVNYNSYLCWDFCNYCEWLIQRFRDTIRRGFNHTKIITNDILNPLNKIVNVYLGTAAVLRKKLNKKSSYHYSSVCDASNVPWGMCSETDRATIAKSCRRTIFKTLTRRGQGYVPECRGSVWTTDQKVYGPRVVGDNILYGCIGVLNLKPNYYQHWSWKDDSEFVLDRFIFLVISSSWYMVVKPKVLNKVYRFTFLSKISSAHKQHTNPLMSIKC